MTQSAKSLFRATKAKSRVATGQSTLLSGLHDHRKPDVLAIRADTRPQRKIAESYQIDAGHVSAIRARKAWRHV